MKTNAKALKKEFEINEITSIHFFEYKSDFLFKTEFHDYWRLLYVEEGTIELLPNKAKAKPFYLSSGNLFLQEPNKCYSFRACSDKNPVLFSIGFYCDSLHLSALCHRIFEASRTEKDILYTLSQESKKSFSPKLSGSADHHLEPSLHQPFGGEQLISIYLELLFIGLIRQYVSAPKKGNVSTTTDAILKTDTVLLNRIMDYYAVHITEHLNIKQLCTEFQIGRAHLQRIFHEETGYGAIEYFCKMRIDKAKKMIRDQQRPLSEIATELGYVSIPYFSRQFKQISGMTPSEYQRSFQSTKNDPIYQQVDYH